MLKFDEVIILIPNSPCVLFQRYNDLMDNSLMIPMFAHQAVHNPKVSDKITTFILN